MNKSRLILLLIITTAVVLTVGYFVYQERRMPADYSGESILNLIEMTEADIQETDGIKHLVPLNQIVSAGIAQDGVPAIDEPKFESVAAADPYLQNEGLGLAVEADGEYRFYPYQILVWHQIVNDEFYGIPLAVSFCPLSYTGIVYERTVDNEAATFGVSGKVYNSNFLMYDRLTESYWNQALGMAIFGPSASKKLKPYPALVMTWQSYKDNFPGGEVLSSDTGYVRDYTRDPYGSYYSDRTIPFALSNTDDRLPAKTVVYGLLDDKTASAYPLELVKQQVVINDSVRGRPIAVWFDQKMSAVRAFYAEADKENLTFSWNGSELSDASGTVWDFNGKAMSGKYSSVQLMEIPIRPSFWFSWIAFYPKTQLFETE